MRQSATRTHKGTPVAPPAGGAGRLRLHWIDDSRYVAAITLMMSVLLIYMAVPSNVLNPHNEVITEPNWYYRALKIALLASGAIILFWRRSLALRLAGQVNGFLVAFIGLVLLSTAWSIEPAITMTRFAAVCTICLVSGCGVLVGWHERRFQQIVRPVFTALMLGSLIFGIVAPVLGREQGTGISLQGAWRGLLGQKNGLGQAASITLLFWAHALLTKEVKFWRFFLGCGLACACLILSRSSTSMFSAVFSIMLLLLLLGGPKGKRRYRVFIVIVFAVMILLYSLTVLNVFPGLDFLLQPIVSITGKDTTFSGRTEIWQVIREHIAQHPLLGTGYGAYWIGPVPTSPSYVFITRESNFYPTEAHNGYLDIVNDLGYVGLLCLLGYLVVFLRQSLALLKIDYRQATLYLALLFEEMINNLSESDWWNLNSSFVVMCFATFSLARALLEHRWREQLQSLPTASTQAGANH